MIPLIQRKALENATAQEPVQAAPQGPVMSPPAFQLQATGAAPIQKVGSPNLKRGGFDYTIVNGDNPWALSVKFYGHGRYFKQIQEANKGKNMIAGVIWQMPEIQIPIGTALEDQKSDQKRLRDLAVSISDEDFEAFRKSMTQDQVINDGNFIELVDIMRGTKMTIDEMGTEQKTYMEGQAKAAKKSVGEFIGGEVAAKGYGGGKATKWNALTPKEKADFRVRFFKVVQQIEASAPDNVKSVIKMAKSKGGGFSFDPADTEKSGAFAYTEDDWKLHCGVSFIEAAEKDITSVYANIAHEMGGHNEYGHEHGFDIVNNALGKMPAAEKKKATSGGNSVYSTYGYMETELWSELREHEYDREDNPTDRPFYSKEKNGKKRDPDVKHQLERIKEAFAPKIAEAMVKSIVNRAQKDDRITFDAFARLLADVKTVYGF